MTDNIKVAFVNHGPDLFDVRHFSIHESINELFEITLACVSLQEEIVFDTIVGKEAALYIDGTKIRVWSGIVAEITQVHGELASEKKAAGGNAASSYQITIVPNLWRATQRKNSRIYQHLTTPAIVTKLLGEWGIVPDKKLTATYKPHEYCVQYQETDYAFICRLLEESGISFYFSHDKTSGTGAEITKLVLNDAPHKNPVYTDKLALVSSHQLNIGVPFFACANVAITQRLRPGKFKLRDFDFRRPLTTPVVASASIGSSPLHEDVLEQYHYVPSAFWFEEQKGGGTPHADDKGIARTDPKEEATVTSEKDENTALVKREMDAERRRRKVVTFQTNAIDLTAGSIVGINQNATDTQDHPRKELAPAKKLLVQETHFEGHSHGDWVQRISAGFAEVAFHPERRTPRPRIYGVQSALVVGPQGKEVWTDEFGRVRLQFHWDREGTYTDGSTCWVRVSDAWAGNGFGAMHHPRVGHEVLVEFFEGDPDQPVVVGRLYNNTTYGGAQAPGVPYTLPDDQTRTGIKTDSSAGGHGYNELYFEDAKGSELVHVQAEKNLSYVVNNAESSSIGGSRSTAIGGSDTIDVGKSRSITVGETYKTGIGEVYTVSVAKQTTIQMIDQTIVATTNKSSLSLAGGTIWLNAEGIHMRAGGAFEVTTQTQRIIVQGGPHVRINEAGAGPAPQVVPPVPAGKPSPPSPGGTSGPVYKPNGGTTMVKPGNTQDVKLDTGADNRKPAPPPPATPPTPAAPTTPDAAEMKKRQDLAQKLVKTGGSGTERDAALVRAQLTKFPSSALQRLDDQGTKVVACRGSVTDYLTNLKGVAPRGWPPGSTWDNVPGLFEHGKNEVVIATIGDGDAAHVPLTGEGHGSANLVLHETAHGIDLGGKGSPLDAGAAYTTARTADLGTLSTYESQAGSAGKEETYAESAARYYSGDATDATAHPNLHNYWASDPFAPTPPKGP